MTKDQLLTRRRALLAGAVALGAAGTAGALTLGSGDAPAPAPVPAAGPPAGPPQNPTANRLQPHTRYCEPPTPPPPHPPP
ncbi:polysaccharide deacetylase family protein, partial [Streptomyces sp. NPDC096080]